MEDNYKQDYFIWSQKLALMLFIGIGTYLEFKYLQDVFFYNQIMRDTDILMCFSGPNEGMPFISFFLVIISSIISWNTFDRNYRIMPAEVRDKVVLLAPIYLISLKYISSTYAMMFI